jgi:hypothetical protein
MSPFFLSLVKCLTEPVVNISFSFNQETRFTQILFSSIMALVLVPSQLRPVVDELITEIDKTQLFKILKL